MQNLTLKSINGIGLDTHFIIPSYQRGYRWDQTQVINLLKDIQEFMKIKITIPSIAFNQSSYVKMNNTLRSSMDNSV